MAEAQAFSYHRAIAPMLWVFVALTSTELVVAHLLLSHWSRVTALVLSILTLGSIGWLIRAIASFRRLPVLLTPATLVMRVGRLKALTVPLADSAGPRGSWDGAAVKRRDLLNPALIAYPNVIVDLRARRPGRRAVSAIAHRLDDPAAFTAALSRALGAPSP